MAAWDSPKQSQPWKRSKANAGNTAPHHMQPTSPVTKLWELCCYLKTCQSFSHLAARSCAITGLWAYREPRHTLLIHSTSCFTYGLASWVTGHWKEEDFSPEDLRLCSSRVQGRQTGEGHGSPLEMAGDGRKTLLKKRKRVRFQREEITLLLLKALKTITMIASNSLSRLNSPTSPQYYCEKLSCVFAVEDYFFVFQGIWVVITRRNAK